MAAQAKFPFAPLKVSMGGGKGATICNYVRPASGFDARRTLCALPIPNQNDDGGERAISTAPRPIREN
ncbi:hypothetical protein ACVWWG_009216 [Bradyrhizobium sp. LB7.2]